jgi:two-component system cell cycle response regulator
MSLRVLLADESSTIKKVMQLALQDFQVEVKAVPVGLDVLEVARVFKPDIVFADVLLSKRSGYEVSADLKSDPGLKNIPVVLMWSGFMEFDEAKAKSSHANQRLEKPFDTETLRSLVQSLVPRLKTNMISNFLSFPNMPEIEEKNEPAHLSMPSDLPTLELDEPEEFEQVPLPGKKPSIPTQIPGSFNKEEEPWSQKDLKEFKIDNVDEYDDLKDASFALSSGVEEIKLSDLDVNPKPTSKVSPPASLPHMTQISHERVEQIMREEIRAVLESIAWKILPDMAERVVREEIQKLMKDAERL